MERLVNILIIDDNETDQIALREILSGSGNILISCHNIQEAADILKRRKAGIIFLNIDSPEFTSMAEFRELIQDYNDNAGYCIVITENIRSGSKLLRGLHNGAVDFISKPFNPHLIQAKTEVYKSLYYKDKRIAQLLSNILPPTVLEDLNTNGKYSPRRVDRGVVLFTDFVDFSVKSKSIKPLKLVNKLEYYFTRFDEICERYKLEKIKTIGDAYMALAGVTEDNEEPVIRACLAALEMRDFMRNEKSVAKALKRDFWEIRIGLHAGPLVAGIIGSSRYSFDVWGDTVNIAARAQQMCDIDEITISNSVAEEVFTYFQLKALGQIDIKKRGGTLEMFQIKSLRKEFSLYSDGKLASVELRKQCHISTVDFEHMRNDVQNRLKSTLPDELIYHDLAHTLNVEKAAMRLGALEGLNDDEMMLLRTAALYHDSGFIFTYANNELHGARFMEQHLPRFGFDGEQINIIRNMILSTSSDMEPVTLLEKILCDADHDYLGRPDYFLVANKLRMELELFDRSFTDEEWLRFQLEFLVSKHRYHTITAKSTRERGKQNRILELKRQLEELVESPR